jgi:hypothetical protein
MLHFNHEILTPCLSPLFSLLLRNHLLSDPVLSKTVFFGQKILPNLTQASSPSLNPFKSEGGQGKMPCENYLLKHYPSNHQWGHEILLWQLQKVTHTMN